MQSLIDKQVERANRNLLLANLLLLALLATVAAVSSRYYRNFFEGPYGSTLGEIARAKGVPERSFVRIEGELLETGYEHVTKTVEKGSNRETDRKVTATYLAFMQEGHTLLVKAPVGTQGTGISGWLDEPGKVEQDVLANLRRDAPDLAPTWMPLVLDATKSRDGGFVGLVLGGLALALCLRNLWVWSSRRSHPGNHPVWKRLARFGEARPLAAQIDMEARGGDVLRFKGGATITPSWFLLQRFFGFDLVSLEKLAWVHKKVIKQKQYFITVNKVYQAILHDRDGGKLTLKAKETEVDRLLGALAERVPWVLVGWSADLEKAWAKRRSEVLSSIDARREEARRASSFGRAG